MEAIELFRTKADFEGGEREIWNRIGRYEDSVFVDSGDEEGTVFRITGVGFEVTHESPVAFLRAPGAQVLPWPVAQPGVLQRFQDLLSLTDDNYALQLAFLLNCLRPGGPFMCLLVEGEQGAGKSILSAAIKRIIDPNAADKLRLPDNERDLVLHAKEFFLLVYDNASGMKGEISDQLCRLSTKGGFAVRELYTNGELFVVVVSRPYIINGISDFANRPDLLERAMIMRLERPPQGQRKTERQIWAEFDDLLPGILAALYDMVSCALRNEKTTEAPTHIRMADTAQWLRAAEPVSGLPPGKLLSVLERSQSELIIDRANNDAVVIALRNLLKAGPFTGTMGELLDRLKAKQERVDRYFPSTAQHLAQRLNRLKTAMALAGIFFSRDHRSRNARPIRVWLEGKEQTTGQDDSEPPPDY